MKPQTSALLAPCIVLALPSSETELKPNGNPLGFVEGTPMDSKRMANPKQLLSEAPWKGHADALRTQCERISTLAAAGLKVRDISSVLGIHPTIVLQHMRNGDALLTRCTSGQEDAP